MWSIATAKNKLSEIVHLAAEKPQILTNRGKPVATFITNW